MKPNKLKYEDKKYLELQEKVLEQLNKRRTTRGLSQVVYIKRDKRIKEPKKIYESQTPYIFLQYLRPVMRWACLKYDISRKYLDLLLYLYPIGVFSVLQFKLMCRTVDMHEIRTMDNLIRGGFIKIWREHKGKGFNAQAKLYSLTSKGTLMCARIHRIMVGEEEIPINNNNPLVKSTTRISNYYLDAIMKMNKKKKAK